MGRGSSGGQTVQDSSPQVTTPDAWCSRIRHGTRDVGASTVRRSASGGKNMQKPIKSLQS